MCTICDKNLEGNLYGVRQCVHTCLHPDMSKVSRTSDTLASAMDSWANPSLVTFQQPATLNRENKNTGLCTFGNNFFHGDKRSKYRHLPFRVATSAARATRPGL